jgi:hypothetical protein
MALYELRTYTLRVGAMAEAVKLYQELPARRAIRAGNRPCSSGIARANCPADCCRSAARWRSHAAFRRSDRCELGPTARHPASPRCRYGSARHRRANDIVNLSRGGILLASVARRFGAEKSLASL